MLVTKVLKKFRKLDSLLVKLYAEANQTEACTIYLCRVIQDIQSLSSSTSQLLSLLGTIQSTELSSLVSTVHLPSLQTVNKLSREFFGLESDQQEEDDEQQVDPLSNLRGRFIYFLKDKVSLVVDLARLSLARVNENLSAALLRYKVHLGPNIKLQRNKRQGYILKIPVTSQPNFKRLRAEEEFTYTEVTAKFTLLQTETLKRLSITAAQAEQDILSETARLVQNTLMHLREHVEVLFQINRLVAQVDVFLQFCSFAKAGGRVCWPKIVSANRGRILINSARDPLLLGAAGFGSSGNGNQYCLTEFTPVQLVLGSQGSGKTSYILNMVRLCILAYNGCPVPADHMELTCINKLLIKLKCIDPAETLLSSMGNELQEIENCLQAVKNNNDQCLVVLDGICSSSNHLDSRAHLKALLEILLLRNVIGLISTGEHTHEDIVDLYHPLGKVILAGGANKGQASVLETQKIDWSNQEPLSFPGDRVWNEVINQNRLLLANKETEDLYSDNAKSWQQNIKQLLFQKIGVNMDTQIMAAALANTRAFIDNLMQN